MGSQVGASLFAIGGRLIGTFIGGPVGGMIGGIAGGLIGSLIFNRGKKPVIPDTQLMNAAYGNPIPIIYGTVRLPGQLLWMSKVTVKQHGAGKGIGQQSTYSYWQNIDSAFCEGVASLIKIFLDGKLFYDNSAANPQELTKYKFAIREYDGTETQLPDPLYVYYVGSEIGFPEAYVPAFRGICHLVFDQIDLAHFGGRLPQITCVWKTNPTYTTIFKRLMRTPGGDCSPFTNNGTWVDPSGTHSMATDWTRMVSWVISQDGTIRAYNLVNQQEFMCVTAAEYSQGWPNLQHAINLPGYPPDAPQYEKMILTGITCGQGSNLYLMGSIGGAVIWGSEPTIWTMDPNTLRVTAEAVVPHVPMITIPNTFWQVVVVTITSTAGTYDMIVGGVLNGNATGGSIVVVNPATGLSQAFSLYWDGFLHYNWLVQGNNDPFTGTAEVWIANSSEFDPSNSVHVWKVTISDADPTSAQCTHEYDITPGMFGVPLPCAWDGQPIQSFFWDPTDDSLIFFHVNFIHIIPSGGTVGGSYNFKISNAGTIIWSNTANGPDQMYTNSDIAFGRVAGQVDWGITGTGVNGINVFDTTTGAFTVSPFDLTTIPRNPNGSYPFFGEGVENYNSQLNAMVYTSVPGTVIGAALPDPNNPNQFGTVWIAYFQRVPDGEYPLAAIIQDICSRVGLDPTTMVDVSLVTQTVWGYAITDAKSAGAALADLCNTFLIDMVESDYKLKFIPRGQGSLVGVQQVDLGTIDPNDAAKFWVHTRPQETEMPLMLTVKYQDYDLDYNPGSEYARRTALPYPTVYSKRRKEMDLSVIANATEARHIAEQLLYGMWAERDIYQTVFSQKYLWLDPGDNITVAVQDLVDPTLIGAYFVRIEQEEIGADYSMKLRFCSEEVTIYDPPATIGDTSLAVTQTLQIAPLGVALLFNSPLLRDSDDTGGTSTRIYFAAGEYNGIPWQGGSMYNSLDGTNFTALATLDQVDTSGVVRNKIGDCVSPFAIDWVNTITVVFNAGSTIPSNTTYDAIYTSPGANAVIIGSEIIQFMTITENTDGSYTLSQLFRGRRGTEWATGTHQPGEQLIWLATGLLGSSTLPVPQVGLAEFWKLVPAGRFISEIFPTSFTYKGWDLMPYGPVDFKRITSGSDLIISWDRRCRIGGYIIDGTDSVPLGESSEEYEAYLLPAAPASGSLQPGTVPAGYTRAFTGLTSPQTTYTAAEMTADGFNPTTGTLYVVVFQLSSVIGRGFPGYQAVPAA